MYKIDTPIKFKIILYSHFFKVLNPGLQITGVLLKFCTKYVHYGISRTGAPDVENFKVFATKTADNREFRFHIGQYEHFLKHIEGMFLPDEYVIETVEKFEPKKASFKPREGWSLREYQQKASDFMVANDQIFNPSKLTTMPMGSGKALSEDSLIKVPGGWKFMGEMKVGDVVTAWDGTPSRVIGVYPQGERPMFRITFSDGRSVECDLDHLWRVETSEKRRWKRVIKTSEIMRLLNLNTYRKNLFIDLPIAEDCPDRELEVDPYILGVILGDGMVTLRGSLNYFKPDKFIAEKISGKLKGNIKIKEYNKPGRYGIVRKVGNHGKNELAEKFKKLGLMGKRSWEKFIPEEYFHGSRKQRLALVQGLMDTDGTAGKSHGHLSYCTTSLELAKGFQYLIRSLGGLAKITEKKPHYTHNGERRQGRLAYTINIRYKKPSELFTLPRKKNRTKDKNQYSDNLRLRIESVEYSGHKPAQCIAIDHPDHLYITDDFIVTHNTVTSMFACSELAKRTAIVILPNYINKWVSDVTEIININSKKVMLVQGGKALKGLIHYAKEQDIKCDFVIFSLTTLRNFFSEYSANTQETIEDYGCAPEDLYKILGIGTVLIDEAHQHLHAVFRLMLHMHVPKLLALSATFIDDDQFIDRMMKIMFPKELRYTEVKMKKYIQVYAYSYNFRNMRNAKIRTTAYGSSNYSHVEFEKSIIKSKDRYVLENYLNMIHYLIKNHWEDKYMQGDKAIVFASTIDMCDIIVKHLQKKYPSRTVRKYTQGDPFDNIIKSDICVSTIQSGGTAIDIPGLRFGLMTTSIKSSKSNLQTLGRLRELKDRDVTFAYLFCEEIPKQVTYHIEKKELFKDWTAYIKELRLPMAI